VHAAEDPRYVAVASPLHTAFVVVLLTVLVAASFISIHGKTGVQGGPLAIYASTFIWQWSMFAIIVIGVRLHGARVGALLGRRWRSLEDVLLDVVIAILFWMGAAMVLFGLKLLAGWITGSGLPPLGHATPQQTQQALDQALKPIRGLIPQNHLQYAMWILTASTAGIVEEFIFRGYLQRQFVSLTKNAAMGIAISAALFGAAHAYQGMVNVVIIGCYGALFGMLAHYRRSIKPGMIAHAWQDILAMLIAVVVSSKHFTP